ncbi:aspartate racemase [Lentzea sp. NBRC 105346]|uniref:aspartate/glutamate racemase family protein n=1 Tax=Lentzea sp. NBRC 105346 TaxID=3032205 RepID=UPI00249F9BFD|nr:aspartate/glutamate racemase family protein [Lentzea sp. NBRC 105346]GLZ29124.1 aspartate racemase [Lentzea sp. NBRC 105346]
MKPLIGVVGGMGPLASAEFLRTIYRMSPVEREQDAPRILLWSDPAVVDRSTAIAHGSIGPLCKSLAHSIEQLLGAGAERIVVACVTAHHAIAHLPMELSQYCVSLVDIVHEELAARRTPHLLLCTNGTRKADVFPSNRRLVLPSDADQERLHALIYGLKQHRGLPETVEFVHTLLDRYEVPGFVAGCTELHLVAAFLGEAALDPLTLVARRIVAGGI